MNARRLGSEGGVLARLHRETVGPPVDLSDFRPADHPPGLVEEARAVWRERLQTEFRSIQIMNRFMTEVVGAGDPLEVYGAALDLVRDEIRHTELCAAMCRALGVEPVLPDPVELRDPERFLRAPMAERALHTAISMLAVNETISVAFIEDLRDRCEYAPVRRVLDATLEDEEGHEDLGWTYVQKSLERFPESTRPAWRELVARTLEPHLSQARPILEGLPSERRSLEAHPDPECARLGLFTPARQALVFQRTWPALERRLAPLGLWPDLPAP